MLAFAVNPFPLHMCLTLVVLCLILVTSKDHSEVLTKRRPEAQGNLFIDMGHKKLPLISQVHHKAVNIVSYTDLKGVKLAGFKV